MNSNVSSNTPSHLSETAADFVCLNCNKALSTKCQIKLDHHHHNNAHTVINVHKCRQHLQQCLALNLQKAKERLPALEQEETKFHRIFSIYQEELAQNEQELKNFFSSFMKLMQDASKYFCKNCINNTNNMSNKSIMHSFMLQKLYIQSNLSDQLLNNCMMM